MQGINPPTPAQLLAVGQQPIMKFEIYVAPDWVNLCTLDAKNYVESIGISLGGAGMTPAPVGGTWNATLANEGGIFHPQHPTSGYDGYCVTGRKVRMSIGARYGGVPYYWQRLIGWMDEPKFSAPDYKVDISGADYMKLLEDTEFQELNNYWGASATYNSIASDGVVGAEIYAENDCMRITLPAVDGIGDWVTSDCNFASYNDGGDGDQPSDFVGRITGGGGSPPAPYIRNVDVGNATAGEEYKVRFMHRHVGGTGLYGLRIRISQASGTCKVVLYFPTDDWKEEILYFTALDTGVIIMGYRIVPRAYDLRIDEISIQGFTPYWKRYYELPGAATGPYYVTLDSGAGAIPCWQGEGDEDWKYDEDAKAGPDPPEHPAKIVYFNINKTVPDGAGLGGNNLVVYYFTQQVPENVIADILVLAKVPNPATGLPYVNQAAALAAMDFVATGAGELIDKVWFSAGSTLLNAIKKICERCDYRFYFKYDGTPVFRPKPAAGGADFTFTDPKHIASASTYQDRNEIRNRIVIKGLKQADTWNKEETMPPELKGEEHDNASITAYGEKTLTISNHLFQTQAAIDAMCISLLAEYKDPKWYTDLEMPFNPVPLELGDNIQWEERLSPVLNITKTGIIRDMKIDNFNTTYKCELT